MYPLRITAFKVLSFGCYGTLIDRDSGIWAALKPLLANGRIGRSRTDVLAAFERHEMALAARTPQLPYCEVLTQAHRALAREGAVLCSDAEHTLFGQSVPKWPAFADAPAALQYFSRYFKTAVLVNADRHSFGASIRRLESKFDLVWTAEEMGSYSPDQHSFHRLIGKITGLGYDPGEILHLGASVHRDIAPAARTGLATAWIDRRSAGEDADRLSTCEGAAFGPRFFSLADVVKAHQEELRSGWAA